MKGITTTAGPPTGGGIASNPTPERSQPKKEEPKQEHYWDFQPMAEYFQQQLDANGSMDTFAAISDPKNAHLFTAEAAERDFGHISDQAGKSADTNQTGSDANATALGYGGWY